MFSQVDQSPERSQGGLGIGLALVRRLVEMHGGTVHAYSEGIGSGSSFTVRLPLSVSAPRIEGPASPELEPVGVRGVRVLVVDDNVDSAVSLAELLSIMGYETQTQHDGLDAVRAASSFLPHVVLLDIGLPRLNGYEAARRIRAGADGRKMLIVAVSGWGQQDDRRKSGEAGFDHHFVKPVELKVLMDVLAAATSTQPGELR